MSSHAVYLKCMSSTSYQEPPWKCSCRAVSLSFCRGGSRHALWPRYPRHLPRKIGVDGWMGKGKETKRTLKKTNKHIEHNEEMKGRGMIINSEVEVEQSKKKKLGRDVDMSQQWGEMENGGLGDVRDNGKLQHKS